MNSLRGGIFIFTFLSVFSTAGYASDDANNVQLEPIFGTGYATSSEHGGMGYHVGARILSNANPTKRWGAEISYVSPFGFKESLSHKNYLAAGIVLQQVFREQFVGTIGTIGYIGVDQNKNNPFGTVAELGWEPKVSERIRLLVALRGEWIFETAAIHRTSVNIGLRF